jgi:hypothetical protein
MTCNREAYGILNLDEEELNENIQSERGQRNKLEFFENA